MVLTHFLCVLLLFCSAFGDLSSLTHVDHLKLPGNLKIASWFDANANGLKEADEPLETSRFKFDVENAIFYQREIPNPNQEIVFLADLEPAKYTVFQDLPEGEKNTFPGQEMSPHISTNVYSQDTSLALFGNVCFLTIGWVIEPIAPNNTIEGSYIKNDDPPVHFIFKTRQQGGKLVAYAVIQNAILPEDHVIWLEKSLIYAYKLGVGDNIRSSFKTFMKQPTRSKHEKIALKS